MRAVKDTPYSLETLEKVSPDLITWTRVVLLMPSCAGRDSFFVAFIGFRRTIL